MLTTRVRQRLALDVLGDDDQRLARLHHRLEHRQQRLQRRQFLLVHENIGILELGDHLLRIGDEIGREIAAVELHALDDVELGLEAFGLLDRDDALVADFLHRGRDHFADRLVAIGRNGADLGDLVVRGDLLRIGLEIGDDGGDREVDAALQVHRVEAGGDRLGAFPDDRSSENGRRGRAVAGGVILLGGDFAHQLGAEILELVGKLDFLGDRHAVLGDARSAEGLFDDDVTAFGTKGHLDRIGENVDAAQHAIAGVGRETDVFGCHVLATPGTSSSNIE